MEILTHHGPGYRSELLDRPNADALFERVSANPHFVRVTLLESTRSQHPTARYFVTCIPDNPEKRELLLQRHQQHRIQRAEREGPDFLWAADGKRPVWHVLSRSGERYEVDSEGNTCSCRDGGVCADNGLVCKHLVAHHFGLGTFLTADQLQRAAQLAQLLQQQPAERKPVALTLAA